MSRWIRGSSGIPSVRAWIIVVLGAALIGTSVPAGATVHGELGDAPDLIPGQITNGLGPLLRIHGSMRDSVDVDVYCVNVVNPALFSATVVGGAAFDTQLFLFWSTGVCGTTVCPPPGTPIVMSDDTPPGAFLLQSTITSTFLPPSPTSYALAISAFGRDPISSGGLMWSGAPANAENLPDGPGGPFPLTGWTGFGESSGDYWILLTGCGPCDPIPQPQTWEESGDAPDDFSGQFTPGSGAILRIYGELVDGSDVDAYRIRINNPAAFSAVSSAGTNNDTELFLFSPTSGSGITFDDDDLGTMFSRLTGTSIPAPGSHTLVISQYDRMAASSGPGIWSPLPANFERPPDGPGAPGPLTDWTGAGTTGGGYYGIRLTGAEFDDGTTDVPGHSTLADLELAVGPNPFHSGTVARYRLGAPAAVKLCVFDLRGRLVRTLVREQQGAGEHSVRWDGRDADGRPAPVGAYTMRLESTASRPAMRRVVLIR